MKIVFVISSLSSGGAERVLSDIANYWATKGWDVTIFTFESRKEDFYYLNPNIKRFSCNSSFKSNFYYWNKIVNNMTKIFSLRSLLKKIKPSIVISFIDVNNILTIISNIGLGNKVIVSERIDPSVNPDITPLWRFLRKVFYRYSNHIVAQTDSASQWLQYYCNCDNVITIPNYLRELSCTNTHKQKLVISVGRLEYQKGFDILINSFSVISKEFPEWNLVIYGEGKERNNLSNLINQHSLNGRVLMPGVIKDIETKMANAGIFVQSSRYEGFPNTLLEAMGIGLPVISTDCKSGPADLIQNGFNGFLIPIENSELLTSCLRKLIHDESLRNQISRNAKSSVLHKYSKSRIIGIWESLI